MNWNYPQYDDCPQYSYSQNYVQCSNVGRISNNIPAVASLEQSQRDSAIWLEEFFKDFDPELMDLDKPETTILDMHENSMFGNDENRKAIKEQRQQKVSDKTEPQIILNGPSPHRRKRIAKFKTHFTRGKPCTVETINRIKNRSQSRSPTTILPRSPTTTTSSSYGSSYENTYLNPPQQQYNSYYSRSPSLSPAAPLSPALSLSPSDFNSSASSSYCPPNYCFSFGPENQHQQQQQQRNQLYPNWNCDNNDNSQYYSSDNLYYRQ